MKTHTIHEPKTREAFGLVGSGKDLPQDIGVPWCSDEKIVGFMFQGPSHTLYALQQGSGIDPCRRCLWAMRKVINAELRCEFREGQIRK